VTVPATGARREGATDVVLDELAGFLTFLHVGANVDATFDALAPASSRVSWTIEGTRAAGAPWRLTRSNLYASTSEISAESASEVAGDVETILTNEFEDVELTSVRVDTSVRAGVDLLSVQRIQAAVGRAKLRNRTSISPRPGQLVRVRIVLKPFQRGRPVRNVDLSFRMPRGVPPVGLLEVGSTPQVPDEECIFEGECEEGPAVASFDGLLKALANARRNNVLSATLRLVPSMRARRTITRTFDAVVAGRATLRIGELGEG
jgi:hypothetical protein